MADEDFADWYPRDGRPRLSPAQLATVCVLQFLLGLSDRQAAEAVRCRIDFKYAPAMELDDPGFHHSVLADFRDRLTEDGRADRLLDLSLARLKEAGLVRERTTQRTDSTHVPAADRLPELLGPARNHPAKVLAVRQRLSRPPRSRQSQHPNGRGHSADAASQRRATPSARAAAATAAVTAGATRSSKGDGMT